MGVGFRFGAGPFRVYVPLTGGRSRRHRRRRASRASTWSHPGCDISHRSQGAAQRCPYGAHRPSSPAAASRVARAAKLSHRSALRAEQKALRRAHNAGRPSVGRRVLGWTCLSMGALFLLSGLTNPNVLVGSLLFALALGWVGSRLALDWPRSRRTPSKPAAAQLVGGPEEPLPPPPPALPETVQAPSTWPESGTPAPTHPLPSVAIHQRESVKGTTDILPRVPAAPGGKPVEPWARATQHVDVVGESHYRANFEAILETLGERLTGYGREFRELRGSVVADPGNPFDENAVAVWVEGQHVGYLDRNTARLYSEPLQDLAEQGLHLRVAARIWVSSDTEGLWGECERRLASAGWGAIVQRVP